jgi:hypothetical protein
LFLIRFFFIGSAACCKFVFSKIHIALTFLI